MKHMKDWKPTKMINPDENHTKWISKPSKNKKFKRNEHRKVPEMNEKYTQKQSNETWKKKNIKKGQKTSDPNKNCTKKPSKRSKNKKFKRNQHRKLPEIGGKWWKMTLKNTYETYNAFKNPKKWANQTKFEPNCHKNHQKNKKFKRNEHRK